MGWGRVLIPGPPSLKATAPPTDHVHEPVEAPKIGSTTRRIPTRSGTWLAAPFSFGVVGPTGDNGTSFPICVCVLKIDISSLKSFLSEMLLFYF